MSSPLPPIFATAGSIYSADPATAAANKGPAIKADGSAWEMRDLSSASLLTSGTLPDGRLSSNVPLINAANVFTADQTATGLVINRNANDHILLNRSGV